jgi:hypothetical protein
MIRKAGTPAVLLSLGLLWLSSCAPGRKEISLDPAAVDAANLARMVNEQSDLVRALVGFGTVTFESPEFGGTAAFELSLRKPDSLLVLLEGPFGIDLGTLFLSRERYLAYNSQENLVVTGVPHGSTIRTIIPFDLTFDEVVNAFSGTFEIRLQEQNVRTYTVDDGMFLLVVECGSHTCSYWIDNAFLQVSRYEVHDDGGAMILQASLSSFAEEGDACVPKRITLWFPGEDRQIAVQYSGLTINPGALSFAYTVPPDARVLNR